MNHLAHLRLARAEPHAQVGALLGDFARGHDLEPLPEGVRAGIRQHRAIDRFTDAHPGFRRSRARIAPPLHRLSGVLVDVFYDHFLARDWDRLGDGRPLREFTAGAYAVFAAHRHWLPPRLQQALPRMVANDWLAACLDLDGVREVLRRMQLRLRRPLPLAAAVDQLAAHYDDFAGDFAAFYPEVAAFAATAG